MLRLPRFWSKPYSREMSIMVMSAYLLHLNMLPSTSTRLILDVLFRVHAERRWSYNLQYLQRRLTNIYTENSVPFSGVKRRATRDCWTKVAITCGLMPSSLSSRRPTTILLAPGYPAVPQTGALLAVLPLACAALALVQALPGLYQTEDPTR